MPYKPTTNFKNSNGDDLGSKLVSRGYLLDAYDSFLLNIIPPGITPTPTLWLWGRNSYGQLGNFSNIARSTPVTTFTGGTNWKQFSGGEEHTAAVKTDGTLWVWGNGATGRLGTVNLISRSTPVTTRPGGTNWKQVSCGDRHTAAVKTDGTLWTWGGNYNGALGTNNTAQRFTPVTTLLGGTNWKQVSCGFFHMSAIKTDGTLWTWGENIFGALGINDTTQRLTPVTTILGGNNWKSVLLNSRSRFTIAQKTDGTLWSWGYNGRGQLGTNRTNDSLTPVTTLLGGTNWKSISSCLNSNFAIRTDGSLWVWGANYDSQLMTGDTDRRLTPVTTLVGGNNWKSIVGGGSYIIANQSIDYI
jgi:alpha-tubulin suppressor-like RCC1 family protein